MNCIIGIHPFERGSHQRLEISLTITTDFSQAAASDDIEQAIDYTALTARIETFVQQGKFQLIETLVERLADEIFEPPMEALEIEVVKPAALEQTRQVGVATRRDRRT